ncbi:MULTISPECIES: hypothetical protein [unclassified Actinotignum]|uniref:hypothetical protein n=1 Tax=unclassified Actinotignum TaxID=2632702 RepID=UPI002A7FA9F0|nr:hypothetical protein [Actinotignum sp. SLA_B059]MDY5127450.1 hypothetical protein [Actinotignum sp. SLA_B059]
MDTFTRALAAAISDYQKACNISTDVMARRLGLTHGTLYAKRAGYRPWKLKELTALARMGVEVPPLDGDRIRYNHRSAA